MSYKLTTQIFIERSKLIHGDKYDYSKVEYKNNHTKVCIICPIHGEFWQSPDSHLKGHGCKKCGNIIKSKNTDIFISKAKEKHGDKYDYSKTKYINAKTKVCIICPIHGEFWQIPNDHIKPNSLGCPLCAIDKRRNDKEHFIKQAKLIHNNKYDYSKVEYINSKTKVCIICPEHGEFWQIPNTHLRNVGCPKCNSSHLENKIRQFLIENNIIFEEQKHFNWLKRQSIDYFLPSKNIVIECQGIQHFKPVKHFGGEKEFKKRLKYDNIKRKLCKDHGIKLLYFSNLHIDYPYEVIEDLTILKQKILEEN